MTRYVAIKFNPALGTSKMNRLGPAEIIIPISTPYGVEIPKEIEQISQYSESDNDEDEEG